MEKGGGVFLSVEVSLVSLCFEECDRMVLLEFLVRRVPGGDVVQ
jgi:hypothetical protein